MSVANLAQKESAFTQTGNTINYSREEVLQHNTINDCWIIIQNKVYDLTPFVQKHPGGKEILLARAGEDATSYFTVKHGLNKEVQHRLEKFKVGELVESERIPLENLDEPFLTELVDEAYALGLFNVPVFYKNPQFWIRLFNITSFFSLSLAALYAGLDWYIAILLVVAQGIIGTAAFGNIAHEATHRNFPKSRVGKIILNITWPVMWPFIPQDPLRYEHNSHHVKIGDPEFDFEVAAFASFIRYSGLVTPKSMHKYQHKLAKYIYPFYANIITTIGGFRSSFWKRHNRKVGWAHAGFITITMIYFIALPALLQGHFFFYALLYLVYQCVLYYGIYVGSAINHFVPQAYRPIPPEMEGKYGYYACHNTTNFCIHSNFWFWYTGGFNVQIEHHLIPFIPVENLRKMIPVVKRLCDKYDYPYHNYDKVVKLWNAHYDYLRVYSSDDTEHKGKILNEVNNKLRYQAH